jgi:hypothetical protein
MTPVEIFAWGFGGSVAVEVVAAAQYFDSASEEFPDRYRKIAFYVVRGLVAVIGGGLALAYQIDKALLAVNIGAATPLIIQAFAQGRGYIPVHGSSLVPSRAQPGAALPSPPKDG